ncbi:ATP/GTP-binding protein [Mobiluncus mulieris]|uniref:ATP/GTP-binding protein n=2 Tax=Mobiluncus mulieris TaxID=2052 RepID=A0A848RQ60_9ACTO|nr:ATP/GTP-binding protein [Mobiluncus mulieris]MCU9972095.1 ATP/GTP-binding protein [Mobiluncus mulieris]NMW91875.1 ATP/GTP-binding protein [Mobiluncus mulieris]NMW94133.1 ATP/GTP-binding protein [Mobiluncus mulieris]PNL42394.1 ATP/GTP-binding protein [Mobiluncus mulieris]
MPTRKRGRRQTPRKEWQPLNMERLASMPRTVQRRGVDYTVSRISGSEKAYICPGCNHPIAPGTPHIVAWATDSGYAPFGLDTGVGARRHWHTRCWGL